VAERALVIIILILVVGIPAAITWAKGQREAFALGWLLIGMVWIVAACRLARPTSWWARFGVRAPHAMAAGAGKAVIGSVGER
jgi:hypothetical protein